MLNMPYRRSQHIMRRFLRRLASYVVLAGMAYGQATQSQPNKPARAEKNPTITEEIAKVKSGDYGLVDVDRIAQAKAVGAIPILKEQFVRKQDGLYKAKIAAALVKLGESDNTYWNYLVRVVTPAVESDAPDFLTYDAQGKSGPGPSQVFLAWAKAHNVSPDSVAEEQVYWNPGKVGFLGDTGDQRAVPLLRRALLSPNHFTEAMAAMALAELQDRESIPDIIAACQRAPAEAASSIAEALVYFDDSQAQAALDRYVPSEEAKILRDARAHGKTPLH